MVREGNVADIVVFDLERIRDTATFFEPHQYAEGIDYVLINGEFVVDGGRATGALPGRVLTKDNQRPRTGQERNSSLFPFSFRVISLAKISRMAPSRSVCITASTRRPSDERAEEHLGHE